MRPDATMMRNSDAPYSSHQPMDTEASNTTIRGIIVKNTPLFQIREKQGGFLMKMPDPKKKSPCGGLKIDKTLIFGRFSEFGIPIFFRDKQGGFL